jgi:hypothetical protein
MKNKIIILMALAVISSISIALCFKNIYPYTSAVKNMVSASDITDSDSESLKYMREEEKMARDFYREMYKKYGITPFKNIKEAEQIHMDAVKDLLTANSIEDPVISDDNGNFTNTELKALYDKFIEKGSISLTEALYAGALIEETDINDLYKEINSTDNTVIKEVYTSLKYASENHLRAFVRNLKFNNMEYTPAVLSKEEFDKIINSEKTGRNNGCIKNNGNCQNKCYGKGGGNNNWKNNNSNNNSNNFRYNPDCQYR